MTLYTDIDQWERWLGKTEHRKQWLDVESLRRFAGALGESLDVEDLMPSLGHWAWFLPTVSADDLGPDGHPLRGHFYPPIDLPSRMFGAAEIHFKRPLTLKVQATQVSRIVSIDHRQGRSGDLVLIEVERTIEQGGHICIIEQQTIVYRGRSESHATVIAAPVEMADPSWRPTSVELFRYSAATFNSHRIHYDVPYATEQEGYPALVVQGPLIAARLFALAQSHGGPMRSFSFRAMRPLFVDQPVTLASTAALGQFEAIRCDRTVAMTAEAIFATGHEPSRQGREAPQTFT